MGVKLFYKCINGAILQLLLASITINSYRINNYVSYQGLAVAGTGLSYLYFDRL